jgi:hypothetical protein
MGGAVDIKVLAYNFPAICIVTGVLLLFAGKSGEGGGLITIGAIFQALYLAVRYKN